MTDLWGTIQLEEEKFSDSKAIEILREQARLLDKKTNGMIKATFSKVEYKKSTSEVIGQTLLSFAGTKEEIKPDKLKVCVLRDLETGDILYSKYEYAFYLMSNLTDEDKKRLEPKLLEEIKQFQEDHKDIAEKFLNHYFSEEIISIDEFQEIIQLRGEKNITMEKIVSNAISQETAEEDFAKVEKIKKSDRTDDKNMSEGEVKK